jgi:hypothetical protein
MKQKIYYYGIISAMILMTGTMFKINHWPGAQILLCTGTILLLVLFLPAALINHYRINGNKENRLLYIATYVTCFVVFTAMLFKIQHWPFAGYLVFIAVPFPFVVFLPVWLYKTSKIRNFDINNTIYVLLFLALQSVFSVLLALNVTLETLNNSMKLDARLISMNEKIGGLPSFPGMPAIIPSADEVIRQIGECRKLLYDRTSLSPENIKSGLYDTRYLTDVDMPANLLLASTDPSPAMKLNSALENFIAELGKIQGKTDLVKNAKAFFELDNITGDDSPWPNRMFQTKYLTWYLVELDAMENFVRLIKQEVSY